MLTPMQVPGVKFNTGDKGGEYLAKLKQLSDAVDAAITQYNTQVQAANDAQNYKTAIEQLQSNIQAISESGLPSQSGHANKALVSNGTATAWLHLSGYNRHEIGAFEVNAGDRVFVQITEETICIAPESVWLFDPLLIHNSKASSHNLIFTIPADATYVIASPESKPNAVAGDTIIIPPGRRLSLQCLEANKMEVI